MDAASFEVAWYNKTLSMRECPEEQIAAARSFLLTREGAVRQRVVQVGLKSLHNMFDQCFCSRPSSPGSTLQRPGW